MRKCHGTNHGLAKPYHKPYQPVYLYHFLVSPPRKWCHRHCLSVCLSVSNFAQILLNGFTSDSPSLNVSSRSLKMSLYCALLYAFVLVSCRQTSEHKQVVTVICHKAASLLHMDGSVVFAMWCQCAPHLIHVPWTHPTQHPKLYLDLYSLVLHTWQQSVPTLYIGPTFPLKIVPSCVDVDPVKYVFPRVHPSPQPNWNLNWFSRFSWLMVVADRLTGHATLTVTIGFIYVVMRCGLTRLPLQGITVSLLPQFQFSHKHTLDRH